MSTSHRVSDEVWASVPERRLPARQVWAVVGLTLVLVVAIAWASRGGLVVPRLETSTLGASWTQGSQRFEYRFEVRNEGATDVELVDLTTDETWLDVLAVRQGAPSSSNDYEPADGRQPGSDLPLTIPAGGSVGLFVTFTVDCAARDDAGVSLVMSARSRLGTHDVTYVPFAGAGPWPTEAADSVCTPYVEPPAS